MIDLLSENEKLRSRIAELSSHQPGAGVRAADFDEILPETVWESDPQGRLTYANAAGLEAFGFSTEDILNGVNLLDVIAPDDQPRARENISKRLRGEDEGLTEYIAIRKDGSTFPMLIRTTRILEGGEAIGLRGLAVDASKQKQIERDLLDNEARLNRSQKIARLGSWELNIKTGKVWWSREHYSLLGLDSDTYSPNWKTVQELVHQGDVDVFTETGKRATKSGAPAIAEVRMRHSDGHFLDIRSHIHWKSKDTLVGTLQDVTDQKRAAEALKESEEKYRTLVDVSPDAVIIHSGGILRYVKGAGLEMFGLKDLESVLGRSAFDFVHRSFHESVKERIVTIQNEGGTAALVEELFLRSDGTPFWAESTACAVTIGEERSILLVLRDVTSRKELEDKLRQTEKLEALGTLAGGVAHDFNNALHAMLGYCAVASSQPETHSNPVLRTSLKGIEESGNRASVLVGQILKFARVTDSERERVNIQPIVLDAVKFLRKSIPSSIEVQSKMERDALYVNADPTQIYQLMLNICTNSSQAIGKEHGRLEIHVYERRKDTDPNDDHDKSENGGTITILIHDTGSEMDKRTRDRAFEPFFTTKAVGEGRAGSIDCSRHRAIFGGISPHR